MGGNVEEFTSFVRAASPALLRFGFFLTGDWGRGEDLVQAALAKTYLAWGRIRAGEPSAYVRRVMVTTNVSWARRRRVSERLTPAARDHVVIDRSAEVDAAELLRELLASLPPRQRAVVALRYCEDLPEAEVAALMGCSVGTVKSQTAKALAKLRDHPFIADLAGQRRGNR